MNAIKALTPEQSRYFDEQRKKRPHYPIRRLLTLAQSIEPDEPLPLPPLPPMPQDFPPTDREKAQALVESLGDFTSGELIDKVFEQGLKLDRQDIYNILHKMHRNGKVDQIGRKQASRGLHLTYRFNPNHKISTRETARRLAEIMPKEGWTADEFFERLVDYGKTSTREYIRNLLAEWAKYGILKRSQAGEKSRPFIYTRP